MTMPVGGKINQIIQCAQGCSTTDTYVGSTNFISRLQVLSSVRTPVPVGAGVVYFFHCAFQLFGAYTKLVSRARLPLALRVPGCTRGTPTKKKACVAHGSFSVRYLIKLVSDALERIL